MPARRKRKSFCPPKGSAGSSPTMDCGLEEEATTSTPPCPSRPQVPSPFRKREEEGAVGRMGGKERVISQLAEGGKLGGGGW